MWKKNNKSLYYWQKENKENFNLNYIQTITDFLFKQISCIVTKLKLNILTKILKLTTL